MPKKMDAEKTTNYLGPMVDELGALEKEIAPWKGKLARADALRKILRGAVKDRAPAKEIQIEGARFVCLMGSAGLETVINKAMLFKRIGQRLFVEIAGMTVKAITDGCAPDVVAAVTSQEQTGTRSLKIMEKGAGAAA